MLKTPVSLRSELFTSYILTIKAVKPTPLKTTNCQIWYKGFYVRFFCFVVIVFYFFVTKFCNFFRKVNLFSTLNILQLKGYKCRGLASLSENLITIYVMLTTSHTNDLVILFVCIILHFGHECQSGSRCHHAFFLYTVELSNYFLIIDEL